MMSRRSPALLLVAVAAAAVLTAVPAAARALAEAPVPPGNSTLPAELLQKCVITPEAAAKADYSGIKKTCGAPLETRCSSCPCALLASLGATLYSLGFHIDLSQVTPADAAAALTQCQDTLLTAMQAAGVSLQSILELTQCPGASSFSFSQCSN
ncbi:hypothetical protein ABPG75_002542 [Micractinium tetrahymenae]